MNATPSTLPCTSSTMAVGLSAKAGAARQHVPTTAPIRLFMAILIQFDQYLPVPIQARCLAAKRPGKCDRNHSLILVHSIRKRFKPATREDSAPASWMDNFIRLGRPQPGGSPLHSPYL